MLPVLATGPSPVALKRAARPSGENSSRISMHILIVSQHFWPESFAINDLACSLAQHGHKVTVLTGKPNYPEGKIAPGYKSYGVQRQIYSGLDLIRLPLVPRGNGSKLRLAINYLSFICSGFFVAPIVLRRLKFDVVFVYATSPLLQALPAVSIARLKRAPLAVWVQDLWPDNLAATGFVKSRWLLKLVEIFVRYIYYHTDLILVQSEAFRKPVEYLVGDPRKIHYYPNTAQLSKVEDWNISDSSIVPQINKKFSIVFAGNLGSAQSLGTILEAAEFLQAITEIRFFIIGGGSREVWLAQEVDRRMLNNVELIERLPPAKMPAIFAASSGLLVTLADSPAFALTIPSKLQAYLAAGRPVIACLNGEGARIVNDANAGLTCPAGDAEALAAAVLKLYGMDPKERNRLGINGRRYFDEHFEPTKRACELVEHFQRISNHSMGAGQ